MGIWVAAIPVAGTVRHRGVQGQQVGVATRRDCDEQPQGGVRIFGVDIQPGRVIAVRKPRPRGRGAPAGPDGRRTLFGGYSGGDHGDEPNIVFGRRAPVDRPQPPGE